MSSNVPGMERHAKTLRAWQLAILRFAVTLDNADRLAVLMIAAELDGVPQTFVFFRILLPMLLPYVLTATLFRMLDSIQQFDIIYAMTQGGPGDTLMVFQIQSYLQAFTFTNIGRSSAILMVLWAITYILSKYFMSTWTRLRERAHGLA